MARITNVDQVILLLQTQLQGKKKVDKKRPSNVAPVQEVQQRPLARVKSIAEEPDLSDEDVHRALIGGLLTEEFGPAIANDPDFQHIIDKVMTTINSDSSGKNLLSSAVTQLKNGRVY